MPPPISQPVAQSHIKHSARTNSSTAKARGAAACRGTPSVSAFTAKELAASDYVLELQSRKENHCETNGCTTNNTAAKVLLTYVLIGFL